MLRIILGLAIGFAGGVAFALFVLVEPPAVRVPPPELPPETAAPPPVTALPPAPPPELPPAASAPVPKPPPAPAVAPGSYAGATAALLANPPAGTRHPGDVEADILDRLNALRHERGLGQLRHRDGLRDAARVHALRMQRDRFFAHEDPDGKGAGDRVAVVDRTGVYRTIGENLGQIEPILAGVGRDMHEGWVNSPGHFANMIKPEFSHVGIGCAQDRRRTYCAQVFGQLAGTLDEAVPLALAPGSQTALAARLDGLEYGGWRLRDGHGKDRGQGTGSPLRVPAGLRGEMQVSILGVRRQSVTRRLIYSLYGPAIVIR